MNISLRLRNLTSAYAYKLVKTSLKSTLRFH